MRWAIKWRKNVPKNRSEYKQFETQVKEISKGFFMDFDTLREIFHI